MDFSLFGVWARTRSDVCHPTPPKNKSQTVNHQIPPSKHCRPPTLPPETQQLPTQRSAKAGHLRGCLKLTKTGTRISLDPVLLGVWRRRGEWEAFSSFGILKTTKDSCQKGALGFVKSFGFPLRTPKTGAPQRRHTNNVDRFWLHFTTPA